MLTLALFILMIDTSSEMLFADGKLLLVFQLGLWKSRASILMKVTLLLPLAPRLEIRHPLLCLLLLLHSIWTLILLLRKPILLLTPQSPNLLLHLVQLFLIIPRTLRLSPPILLSLNFPNTHSALLFDSRMDLIPWLKNSHSSLLINQT
jgi:hypothetical protein